MDVQYENDERAKNVVSNLETILAKRLNVYGELLETTHLP